MSAIFYDYFLSFCQFSELFHAIYSSLLLLILSLRLQHHYAIHLRFDCCSLGLLCLFNLLQVTKNNFVYSDSLAYSALLASCNCLFTLLLRLLEGFSFHGSSLLFLILSSCIFADLDSALATLYNKTHLFLLLRYGLLIPPSTLGSTLGSLLVYYSLFPILFIPN